MSALSMSHTRTSVQRADFLVGEHADILNLRVDRNARRTHRLNIAETIARKLERYLRNSLFEVSIR
jgi:ribosomal protein S18 acetylase RimI-like enzyme